MRIRVPGRVIAVTAALAAVLCLLPASSHVAVAVPIGFQDLGPPTPPSGDNDGVVLKPGPAGTLRPAGRVMVPISTSTSTSSSLRLFLAVMSSRLDYWFIWVR